MLAAIEVEHGCHFNSIKVRLELRRASLWSWFILFQFHKGTIRTFSEKSAGGLQGNFNSIKVQLEHQQTGAISTQTTISIP